MTTDPTTSAAHQHDWHDTGFSDLDECACGATRSTTTGRVIEADELATLEERVHIVLDGQTYRAMGHEGGK